MARLARAAATKIKLRLEFDRDGALLPQEHVHVPVFSARTFRWVCSRAVVGEPCIPFAALPR